MAYLGIINTEGLLVNWCWGQIWGQPQQWFSFKRSNWWRVWCESVKWHLLVGGGREYLYFGCVWWEVCRLVFFSPSSLFSVPKFCSCALIYVKRTKLQVCSVPVPSLIRDQDGNSSTPLGKGLGYCMCDMKADELIKSWLRYGKYWCVCYSMKPLLNLSQKAGSTLGVQESALWLSTKAGWPLFTAVPFWKHSVKYLWFFFFLVKCKKKNLESFKFPFKPGRIGKPSCFGMQMGLLQKRIGNKPSLKQLGLIPIRVGMQDQMVSSPVTILVFIYVKTHF